MVFYVLQKESTMLVFGAINNLCRICLCIFLFGWTAIANLPQSQVQWRYFIPGTVLQWVSLSSYNWRPSTCAVNIFHIFVIIRVKDRRSRRFENMERTPKYAAPKAPVLMVLQFFYRNVAPREWWAGRMWHFSHEKKTFWGVCSSNVSVRDLALRGWQFLRERHHYTENKTLIFRRATAVFDGFPALRATSPSWRFVFWKRDWTSYRSTVFEGRMVFQEWRFRLQWTNVPERKWD